MRTSLHVWARIAEIASAIAVVVSVIYLALQISANNKLLRSQAHSNALTLAQRPLEMMVESEGLAEIVTHCDADPDNVPTATWERCRNYYFMQLNSWEYMFYQHQDDSIPRQLWVGADASFKLRLKTKPGYRRVWRELETAFDEPFRTYVTEEFDRHTSAAATAR